MFVALFFFVSGRWKKEMEEGGEGSNPKVIFAP